MSRKLAPILAVVVALVAGACVPVALSPEGLTSWQSEMLASINAQRSAVGAPPLVACGTLNQAAAGHSADQANHDKMTHTGSDGSSAGQRIQSAGYVGFNAWGENVAAGYPSVGAVMAGWMGSPGHKANILSKSFQHVGMGLANSANGTPYWTQVFGANGSC